MTATPASDTDFSALQDELLEILEGMGGTARNPELQQALGWDAATYEAVKDALVERRILVKGRGRSNSVSIRGMEAALPPRSASSGTGNGNGRRNAQATQAPAPATPPPEPGDPSRGFTGWVAPPERDLGKAAMEKRLWEAADQFRANSGLKAQEYSGPILGLIFLRFADARFMPKWQQLQAAGGSERRGTRQEDPNAYQSEGLLYLPPGARYQELLELPEGADIGERLNGAMRLIEEQNSKLAGVLPKSYNLFTPQLLAGLLKRISEIPTDLEFDAFGRIYEYFLGEFARSEGQKGGEFFTPSSLVVLITEIVEPFAGRLLDPACGSGGMYVQSARFVKPTAATRPVIWRSAGWRRPMKPAGSAA